MSVMNQDELKELRNDVKQISKDVIEIKTKVEYFPCSLHSKAIESLKRNMWIWYGGLLVAIFFLELLTKLK